MDNMCLKKIQRLLVLTVFIGALCVLFDYSEMKPENSSNGTDYSQENIELNLFFLPNDNYPVYFFKVISRNEIALYKYDGSNVQQMTFWDGAQSLTMDDAQYWKMNVLGDYIVFVDNLNGRKTNKTLIICTEDTSYEWITIEEVASISGANPVLSDALGHFYFSTSAGLLSLNIMTKETSLVTKGYTIMPYYQLVNCNNCTVSYYDRHNARFIELNIVTGETRIQYVAMSMKNEAMSFELNKCYYSFSIGQKRYLTNTNDMITADANQIIVNGKEVEVSAIYGWLLYYEDVYYCINQKSGKTVALEDFPVFYCGGGVFALKDSNGKVLYWDAIHDSEIFF